MPGRSLKAICCEARWCCVATPLVGGGVVLPSPHFNAKTIRRSLKYGHQKEKYQLTINNPIEHGYSHDQIKSKLLELGDILYWCMADEIGLESQTPHTHIYLHFENDRSLNRIKKLFPEAHIEIAKGSAIDNRNYIQKMGKWKDDPKSDTSIPDSFEESGEMPDEPGQGFRSDLHEMYVMIKCGFSNIQILEENPELLPHISLMDKVRLEYLTEKYKSDFRKLNVTYIWGATNTGKTRGIMEKHEYQNVFRVTNYKHPFDGYKCEPVLCLDEFRSGILMNEMLNYLDGYPLELPARYSNRFACYETVYIISNIDLKQQYPIIQATEPETWKAFLRRIRKVIEYKSDGTIIDRGSAMDYIFPPVPDWVNLAENSTQEIIPLSSH